MLRPVAVAALRGGVPENFKAPGVIQRQVMTWVLSTGVPILAIVLALAASKFEILTASADRLTMPILLLAIAALVIGYFGVNAYSGNHGLRAKQDLDQEIARLGGELETLRAERVKWERRVSLLKPESIDPDMLDERARVMLGYLDRRELTLILKRP